MAQLAHLGSPVPSPTGLVCAQMSELWWAAQPSIL